MKLRTTTPASTSSFIAKSLIVASVIVMAFAVPIQLSQSAFADKYDEQIQALQEDIDKYQAEAARLSEQATTLETEIAKLAGQKAIIQTQIDLNQAKYNKLVADIKATEIKIQENQDVLGDTIADLYIGDKVTPLEMIASSKSVGEYLDKQQYRNSIRDELTATIAEIEALKKDLDSQKKDVEFVLGEQKDARKALAEKEAQQASLLAETKGQESAYQQLAAEGEEKRKELQKQQTAAILAAQNRGGTSTLISDPTKGGYPYEVNCRVDDALFSYGGTYGDGTDAIGYACRQCTSYAAWKIQEYTGRQYTNMGHAAQWIGSSQGRDIPGSYSTPRANSVGVISNGPYGHVVWVESDADAEGYIIISQYNSYNDGGPGYGHYSKKRIHQSTYDYFIYF